MKVLKLKLIKEKLLDFHLEEQEVYSGIGCKYECVCV
jgi:hypothetical protein